MIISNLHLLVQDCVSVLIFISSQENNLDKKLYYVYQLTVSVMILIDKLDACQDISYLQCLTIWRTQSVPQKIPYKNYTSLQILQKSQKFEIIIVNTYKYPNNNLHIICVQDLPLLSKKLEACLTTGHYLMITEVYTQSLLKVRAVMDLIPDQECNYQNTLQVIMVIHKIIWYCYELCNMLVEVLIPN